MAKLLSVATAVPEHRVTCAETKAYLARLLGRERAARFGGLVDAAQNETRYSVLPLEELLHLANVEERNREYARHAVPLATRAAREALSVAGAGASEIETLICVSSTGYLMPSLDVHMANQLGINPRCRRLSLTQVGCAGGVASLSLAAEMIRGKENCKALVVSVETPSLSLQVGEPSPTDVVSSTQFGDGAGAAVLSADTSCLAPEISATGTRYAADTIERDGIRLTETGLRLMRQRGVAHFIRGFLPGSVRSFLDQHRLTHGDISFWVVHPRSPQVLSAARDALELEDSALQPSWAVWRRCGNLISASMFFILGQLRELRNTSRGDLGLMVAVGAGMTCEMALLRSDGWLAAEA
jgi:alkylresorcinol/alkylpyrone synthase